MSETEHLVSPPPTRTPGLPTRQPERPVSPPANLGKPLTSLLLENKVSNGTGWSYRAWVGTVDLLRMNYLASLCLGFLLCKMEIITSTLTALTYGGTVKMKSYCISSTKNRVHHIGTAIPIGNDHYDDQMSPLLSATAICLVFLNEG